MSERTEAPTPRHREKLRKQGQVASSVELSAALGLLVGVYLLRSQGAAIVNGLGQLMHMAFGAISRHDLTLVTLQAKGTVLALSMMRMMAPLVLGVMVTGILATVAQTKGLVALALLRPNLGRIDPLANIRRLTSRRSLVEFLKSLGKVAIIGLVVFQPLPEQAMEIAAASTAGLSGGIGLLGSILYQIAIRVAFLFVGIAVVDYVFQWRQFQQSIRMTREEVKEEMKSAEGSPLMKGRVRQMQRRWARQRMMQQVPQADVVVTNPTHLAIALKYDGQTMMAPMVVAKGKGVVAAQIVKVARQHRVPVIENRPLAHALIQVEVGAQIPPALYQAVAAVLAFVYRLRQSQS